MIDLNDDLQARVSRIGWYHRIELPGGVTTPGINDPRDSLQRLQLPESLVGKSVLDIGAWDGFYSFECARRGASRVLATDSFAWDGSSWGTRDGFLLARAALGVQDVVDDRLVDVMDLSRDAVGQFDVVLLLGVVYHLTDPIRALERVAECCTDLLVLETETALNLLPFPAARLHPGRSLNNDPTNWYQYNVAALRGLLARVGFGDVSVKFRTPLPPRVKLAVNQARSGGNTFWQSFWSQRIVVHAHRTQPVAN